MNAELDSGARVRLYEIRKRRTQRTVSRVCSRLDRRRRRDGGDGRRRRGGGSRGCRRRQRRVGRRRASVQTARSHRWRRPTSDALGRRPLRRRRRAHAPARAVRQLKPVVRLQEFAVRDVGAVWQQRGVADSTGVEHRGVRMRQDSLILGVRLVVVGQLQLHAARTSNTTNTTRLLFLSYNSCLLTTTTLDAAHSSRTAVCVCLCVQTITFELNNL